MCYGAEKRQWPADTTHTQAGLLVCCERALKASANGLHTGGAGTGAFGKPPARAREVTLRGGVQRRFGGGGFSPCRRIADRKYRLALRVAAPWH
jgi:hypothetical protein